MTTAELRKLVKRIEPGARVSGGERCFTITVDKYTSYKEVKALLSEWKLDLYLMEVVGGRFNWSYRLHVQA